MLTLRFSFYVETDTPAGPSCEQQHIDRDFITDDIDHAIELAERAWDDKHFPIRPARYMNGTLSIHVSE